MLIPVLRSIKGKNKIWSHITFGKNNMSLGDLDLSPWFHHLFITWKTLPGPLITFSCLNLFFSQFFLSHSWLKLVMHTHEGSSNLHILSYNTDCKVLSFMFMLSKHLPLFPGPSFQLNLPLRHVKTKQTLGKHTDNKINGQHGDNS